MIAAWPDPASFAGWLDEGAEASVSKLIELVVAVRAIRARYKIEPKTKVPIAVRVSGDSDLRLLEADFGYLQKLAGVSAFEAAADLAKPPHSAVAIAGGMEIYVPLEGLVDFDAERARLSREREKIAADLEKLTRKLANEGFLAKASPEIVEKDRAKAADLAESLTALDAQLAELA